MLWQFLRRLSGHWFRQEAGEGRPLWFAAWRVGEPLAEAEEVEAGGGEDVAEVDLRLPARACPAQPTAADAAVEEVASPHGVKYVLDGAVVAPHGDTLRLRTIWIVEPTVGYPRFVTAYPAPGGAGEQGG